MPDTLRISLDGTTDLPAGKIACIVTSLEMRARPVPLADPPGTEGLALAPIGAGDLDRYLAVYRLLGERWMWFSRLVLSREKLAAILADPGIAAFAVRSGARDLGLLELDFRERDEVELAFFGLDESLIGRGAGRWLMNRALALAWAKPIGRFWVHTCTIDHPGAPEFYRRSGFRVFKRSVEIADDPRLTGAMRVDAAPHHPVIP